MIPFTLLLSKLICFTATATFTINKAHQNDACALVRQKGHQMQSSLSQRNSPPG